MSSKRQSCNLLFCWRERAATVALVMVLVLTMVLTPTAQGQTYSVIYNFTGGTDGYAPWTGLTIDSAGNFYGTT